VKGVEAGRPKGLLGLACEFTSQTHNISNKLPARERYIVRKSPIAELSKGKLHMMIN
jgi:hypothetical protein